MILCGVIIPEAYQYLLRDDPAQSGEHIFWVTYVIQKIKAYFRIKTARSFSFEKRAKKETFSFSVLQKMSGLRAQAVC